MSGGVHPVRPRFRSFGREDQASSFALPALYAHVVDVLPVFKATRAEDRRIHEGRTESVELDCL
jgi:hypothetical protein